MDIFDNQRNKQEIWILLDSGSQSSVNREGLIEKLGLSVKFINTVISGINNAQSNSPKIVTLFYRVNSYKCSILCLVLPKITNSLTQTSLDVTDISLPENVCLQHLAFHQAESIHILLGAEMF